MNARGAGAYSAVDTVVPSLVPDMVTGLNVTIADQGFSASWSAPADNGHALTRYILVYKNVTASASYPALRTDNTACEDTGGTAITNSAQNGCVEVAASGTTVSVSSLTNGANYEVKVLAVNGQGAGAYSVAATVMPGREPGAVNGLSLTIVDHQAFSASWSAPAANGHAITGYILVYKNVTGSASYPTLTASNACPSTANSAQSGCVAITTGSPTIDTTVSVASLRFGETYEVKVLAVNGQGAGAYSAVATVMPDGLSTVRELSLAARSPCGIRALWRENSSISLANFVRYIVVYRNQTDSTSYPALRTGNTSLCSC